MGFFDNSPFIFDEKDLNRMNERYIRIIRDNLNCVKGKSILDLGSFNGRWSWAALKSGASFVLGIEGRAHIMESKLDEFQIFDKNRYHFICADIFDALAHLNETRKYKFDTILCLGIFYHIMDHFRLFKLIAGLNPKTIILDTGLLLTSELTIRAYKENTESPFNALPGGEKNNEAIVGIISRGLLQEFAAHFHYDVQYMNWDIKDAKNLDNLNDYFQKGEDRRFTIALTKRSD